MISNTTDNRDDFPNQFYMVLSTFGVERLFHNVRTLVEGYHANGRFILATVTDAVLEHNCYVVSPYALIISYAKVELHKLRSPFLILPFKLLITLFSRILRASEIDKIQIVNNVMLSTNFFDDDWNNVDIAALMGVATERHPGHALAIRSINSVQNKPLTEKLLRHNWLPFVTRQVYIFKDFNFKKRDVVRDLELLQSTRYLFVDPDPTNLEHFQIAESLYNQLYLGKYTEENIQYTALYMQALYVRDLLHLKLLYDSERGVFVGVVGIIGNTTTLTAPIVGYDMSRPSGDALYRRCIIYIMKYAHEKKILLNLSSGAPGFKMNRGAQPEIEYMFVSVRHLRIGRRLIWGILSKISLYVYRPLLRTYKL